MTHQMLEKARIELNTSEHGMDAVIKKVAMVLRIIIGLAFYAGIASSLMHSGLDPSIEHALLGSAIPLVLNETSLRYFGGRQNKARDQALNTTTSAAGSLRAAADS